MMSKITGPKKTGWSTITLVKELMKRVEFVGYQIAF
jgi:hypothetical protein